MPDDPNTAADTQPEAIVDPFADFSDEAFGVDATGLLGDREGDELADAGGPDGSADAETGGQDTGDGGEPGGEADGSGDAPGGSTASSGGYTAPEVPDEWPDEAKHEYLRLHRQEYENNRFIGDRNRQLGELREKVARLEGRDEVRQEARTGRDQPGNEADTFARLAEMDDDAFAAELLGREVEREDPTTGQVTTVREGGKPKQVLSDLSYGMGYLATEDFLAQQGITPQHLKALKELADPHLQVEAASPMIETFMSRYNVPPEAQPQRTQLLKSFIAQNPKRYAAISDPDVATDLLVSDINNYLRQHQASGGSVNPNGGANGAAGTAGPNGAVNGNAGGQPDAESARRQQAAQAAGTPAPTRSRVPRTRAEAMSAMEKEFDESFD